MAVAYVDPVEGKDTNPGTQALPYRSLAMIDNFLPGGNGGILIASDGEFEINPTLATSNGSAQTRFNGALGQTAYIGRYYPRGDYNSKPIIRYRMLPKPADWTWDATLQFGYPKGWYLQFDWTFNFWDVFVKVAGQYVGTMNQDTTNNAGLGYINGGQNNAPGGFVNGMSLNTIRFNVDYGGANVAGKTTTRIYLSGIGLQQPGAGNDPSSVVGPGQIVLGLRPFFSFYTSLNYVTFEGLSFKEGGGAAIIQSADNSVINKMEFSNCDFEETSVGFRFNSGAGTAANTFWELNLHSCNSKNHSGPFTHVYGPGITGVIENNTVNRNNLCSSMGGAFYIQVNTTTYNGNRLPLKIRYNVVSGAVNGAGNNAFDGSCYYADIQDNGSIFYGNWALNSYLALQCGSGARSEWYSNIAVNCEKLGMWDNAAAIQTQDYVIANNLCFAAPRGTFSHGDVADVHPYVLTVYQSGTPANLVGGKVVNNHIVIPAIDSTRVPINAYDATQWASGKLQIARNLCSGGSVRQVVSDFNSIDRTAQADCLAKTLKPDFVAESSYNYTLGSNTQLAQTGVDVVYPGITDARGNLYYSPPTVGPYEVPRKLSLFGPIGR